MKRSSVFLCLLLLPTWGLSQQVETLAAVTAEYDAKRAAGLKRLNDEAKAQLEAVKKAQMTIGNLDGANAAQAAISTVPMTSTNPAAAPDTTAEGLPAEAGAVLADHSTKVCAGIIGLNKLYIPRFETLKGTLLQAGDLAGANAAVAKAKMLTDEMALLTPLASVKSTKKAGTEKVAAETSFTIEGLIDGNTELHVTKEGIYWVVLGGEAKVGTINGGNESTYVNGTRWKPKWRTQGARGPDASDVYPLPNPALNLLAQQVSVSKERFGKDGTRTPISTAVKGDHFVITFKDPEGGGMWYKVRVKSLPKP